MKYQRYLGEKTHIKSHERNTWLHVSIGGGIEEVGEEEDAISRNVASQALMGGIVVVVVVA